MKTNVYRLILEGEKWSWFDKKNVHQEIRKF